MIEHAITIAAFDDPPEHARLAVDEGLERHNLAVAPLSEVRPLAVIAALPSGHVVGGVVGRTWGKCCELLELWVEPEHRGKGLASSVVARLERHAASRGCSVFYLTTLSYQAPEFYRKQGYGVLAQISGYPNGIVKYLMQKVVPEGNAMGEDGAMRPDTKGSA